jgi:hypothetical protein
MSVCYLNLPLGFTTALMSAMSQDISTVKFHIVFQTVLVFTNKELSDDTITA